MTAAPWSDDDVVTLAKKHLIFRVRSRREGGRLQRWSDHLRGGVFGAAVVLALVAVAVLYRGGPVT